MGPGDARSADGKGLGKLTAFARLKEAHALYKLVEHEITEEPLRQFIGSEITAIADELGGGYFHYGPTKLRLYSRARSRAGRLVARTMLGDSPDGLTWALVQMAESVAALCRRMTRSARPLGTQRHIDSGRVAVSSPSIGASESHG